MHHFKPTCKFYPILDIKSLGPPFDKNLDQLDDPDIKSTTGYAGMRLCYLERRRGMGPDGNETHYIVYEEDTLTMLCAATTTNTNGTYHFSGR